MLLHFQMNNIEHSYHNSNRIIIKILQLKYIPHNKIITATAIILIINLNQINVY
jgi:hypothetical protein